MYPGLGSCTVTLTNSGPGSPFNLPKHLGNSQGSLVSCVIEKEKPHNYLRTQEPGTSNGVNHVILLCSIIPAIQIIMRTSTPNTNHTLTPRHGHISLINLQRPLNTLYQTRKRRDDQHQDGHPEGIPLRPIPTITPPLPEGARRGVVVGLLQDDESVSPEVEALDLSVFGLEAAAACEAGVDCVVGVCCDGL